MLALVLSGSCARPAHADDPPATSRPATSQTQPTTAAAAEAEGWIARLGDHDWKVRTLAEDKLAEMGDAIEPRLHRLIVETADSEVRARAEVALRRIEMMHRLGPTLVTVRLDHAAPQAAFATLATLGRVPIVPLRESLWRQRDWPPLTMDLVAQPFWAALRQVCAAEGLCPLFAGGEGEPGRIVLALDAPGEMARPATFSGSFMILATSLSRRPAGPDAPADGGTEAELQLKFFADPKWRVIEHPDQVDIQLITDDRGRQLKAPEPMRMQGFKADSPIWLMRTVLPRVPADSVRLARLGGSFRITLLEMSDAAEFPNVLSARAVARRVGAHVVQLREVVAEDDAYVARIMVARNGLSPQTWRQAHEIDAVRLLDAKDQPLSRTSFQAEERGDQTYYDIRFSKPRASASSGGSAAPAKMVCQVPLEPREITIAFEFADLPIEK